MLLMYITFDQNEAECRSLDKIFFSIYSEPTADIIVYKLFFFSSPVGVATEIWTFATLFVQFRSQFL